MPPWPPSTHLGRNNLKAAAPRQRLVFEGGEDPSDAASFIRSGRIDRRYRLLWQQRRRGNEIGLHDDRAAQRRGEREDLPPLGRACERGGQGDRPYRRAR